MTEIPHGTYVAYRSHRCRCDSCRDWKRSDNERSKSLATTRESRHGTSSAYRYGCRCVECSEAKMKENAISNPRRSDESLHEAHLKRKYGLSGDDYRRMWESQRGKCAICNQPSEKKLMVDHCHGSGSVRELLCGHCNSALGFARDDPGILRAMADYIEKHGR